MPFLRVVLGSSWNKTWNSLVWNAWNRVFHSKEIFLSTRHSMLVNDPSGYRWPPTIPLAQNSYFRLAVFFFWQFSGPKLSGSFWGPKWHFFLHRLASRAIESFSILSLYSSARPFQRSLKWPKRRLYAKVMPPGSRVTNLPLWGK